MASIGHLDPRKSGSVSSPRSRRALAATLLLTAFAAAQDEKPTFQATTRLLEFSFAAVDKKGAPITDLRKDELVLLVDGKPYDLAFFRFEGSAAQAAPAPPALPPGIFTNRIELTGGPARNITALLIDSANTEPKDQMFVKAQALQFLAALAPQTHVAVFQLGQNLRVLHDFTSDMTSLRKSLKSVKVEFASPKLSDMERLATEADELLARLGASENSPLGGQLYTAVAGEANYNTLLQGNRVESTMTALDMLGRHLAGVPGRKSLIWISGGVAMTPVRVAPHRMPSQRAGQTNPAVGENHQKLIRAAAERLARSGIALYAVDARGIHSPADDLASRQEPPSRRGVFLEVAASESYGSDSRAGFDLLTTITGGRFIFGTNDFSQAIRKATADLHGSYSLGFYPRDPQPAGWRKLQVTVRRPGVTLLHPSGFSLDAPSGEFGQEALRMAMLNPLGSSAIRLNAHCRRASRDHSGVVDLVAQVDADDLMLQQKEGRFVGRLDVYVGEKTAVGGLTLSNSIVRLNFTPHQWAAARAKGLPYRRSWKPGPSTVTIRLLVREPETGRMGAVDIPVSKIAPV